MVTVGLIVVIEGAALLYAISSKQCRIQVEQNMLRLFDGVSSPAKGPLNGFQLPQTLFVHTVMEARQGRLRGQGRFPNHGVYYRIVPQTVSVIILEVSARNLVEHLQKILVILVDSEQGWVCRVELLPKQVLDSELVVKLFEQKQAAV